MWTDEQRTRFRELRQRQQEATLTSDERSEMASLVREIENTEEAYLASAAARMRLERESLEAQNRALEMLAERKQALVSHIRGVLAQAESERQAIASEIASVLGSTPGANAGS
jgi:hypothetical protein